MTSLLTQAPSGMPWVAALVAIGACFGMLIKAWSVLRKVELDASGRREKLDADADATMLSAAMGRISALETRIGDLETQLVREQAKHSAEIQVLRHELANESASLDAFILLAEANPDKVFEALPRIKEMRERRKMRVAAEKGAMAGAQMGVSE